MKNSTSEQLVFSSIRGKKVGGVFDDHGVMSDAGVLVLREVGQRIKVTDALTDAIVDSHHPSYVRHEIAVELMIKEHKRHLHSDAAKRQLRWHQPRQRRRSRQISFAFSSTAPPMF